MKSHQREVRGEPDTQAMIALDLYRGVKFHPTRGAVVYRKDYGGSHG